MRGHGTGLTLQAPPGRNAQPLSPTFYRRPNLTVARELLGRYLVREQRGIRLGGLIVEVEAYHQHGDQAAHTYAGRTERNAVMFEPGGVLYVYFTYGMHFCMNVVTETAGIGAAVLIRAIEPVEGIALMTERRNAPRDVRALTNGPAKCCQALGIQRDANGTDLVCGDIRIYPGVQVSRASIHRSERIGIKKSTELDWRFTIRDSAYLSRKPGTRRLFDP